jgi:peroxiredoxin
MRTIVSWIALVAVGSVLSPLAASAAPKGFTELKIGDAAPDFDLPGVDGENHKLADFADAKLLLVVFTCNHCPTAQAYESRIMQLHEDYQDRGVALVAISPNDDRALRLDELGYTDLGDSFEEMKQRAAERGFQFPYLYDGETQKVALAYGVVATPQVFLFDEDRKLRYVGRIDDSDVKTVKSHDARNAIDALLAGQHVPVEKTRTFGCSTKWSEKRADAEASIKKWNEEPVELASLDEETLTKLAANDTEDLLVVNVWATWCGPCVKEMPEFVAINRMYRGRRFRMATISLDEPEQREDALAMLERNHVSCTNYFPTFADRDRLAELLDKEWQGPLPYTVLIAPGGKVVYRQNEEIKPLELRREIVNVLGRTYGSDPEK